MKLNHGHTFFPWSALNDYLFIIITDPQEDYYLLCDALPEDKDVRHKLQVQKLVGYVYRNKK